MSHENPIYFSRFRLEYLSSIIIVFLVCLTSIIGIIFNPSVYTPIQQVGNLATDWTNLLIVLPVLVLSMWFCYKNNLLGLLLWPSALLYFVFVYFFYAIAVPFDWIFLSFITIVSLSGYTFISLISRINKENVHSAYVNKVPHKVIGGVLLFFGVGFILLDISKMIELFGKTQPVTIDDYVPWIVDFTVGIPLLIISGVLLWQKHELGYVLGPGLLFYLVLLDFGVTILYLFKWAYGEPDFEFGALIVFFIITIVSLLPLYYFKKATSLKDLI